MSIEQKARVGGCKFELTLKSILSPCVGERGVKLDIAEMTQAVWQKVGNRSRILAGFKFTSFSLLELIEKLRD